MNHKLTTVLLSAALLLLAACGGGAIVEGFNDGNNSVAEADPLDDSGTATAVLSLAQGDSADFFGPVVWDQEGSESGSSSLSQDEAPTRAGRVSVDAELSLPEGEAPVGDVAVVLYTSLPGRNTQPDGQVRPFRQLAEQGYGEAFLNEDGDSATVELGWLGPEFSGRVWAGVLYAEEEVSGDEPDLTVELEVSTETTEPEAITDLEPNNTRNTANPFTTVEPSGRVGGADPADLLSFVVGDEGDFSLSGSAGEPVTVELFRGQQESPEHQLTDTTDPELETALESGTWYLQISRSGPVTSYDMELETPAVEGGADALIAFTAPGTGGNPDLHQIRPNGTGRRNLSGAVDADEFAPVWDADHRSVAALARTGQSEFDVGVFRNGEYNLLGLDDVAEAPVLLNPGGTSIFFSGEGSGGPDQPPIYRVPAGGGTPQQLPAGGTAVELGPDGQTLLVSESADGGLFATPVDTDDKTELAGSFDRFSQGAEFAPDGESVFLQKQAQGRIVEHELDTQAETELPDIGPVAHFSVSPDGAHVAATVEQQQSTELVLIDLGDNSTETVSTEGNPLTSSFSPDGSRVAWVQTSDDGSSVWVSEVDQPSPAKVPNTDGAASGGNLGIAWSY